MIVGNNPQLRQYEIRVDGSGRVTKRNRRFIRKIDPVCRTAPYSPLPGNKNELSDHEDHVHVSGPDCQVGTPTFPVPPVFPAEHPPSESVLQPAPSPPTIPAAQDKQTCAVTKKNDILKDTMVREKTKSPAEPPSQEVVRRSQRQRKQTSFFKIDSTKGKSYTKTDNDTIKE